MKDDQDIYDVFVVGGGINGCGIARDAVGRGYRVFLAEKDDLASGTSSGSTKLIHGGLRYLEHYEFMLVRKALQEREVLWKIAPHIIKPLRFILPHHKDLRPAWFIRLGLFMYDHMGGRKLLPATKTVNLKTDEAGAPLQPLFDKGFEYSDCWVDDARLVVLNAMDVKNLGGIVRTKTNVTSAKQIEGVWNIQIEDSETGQNEAIKARVLINAAGPWVDRFLNQSSGAERIQNVRLVQGSHIVVDKMFDHDKCYIFQNADNRIIFAIPYENDFTMIGTTDQDYEGDLDKVSITDEEIEYLCKSASEYFKKKVSPDQVKWQFSGVRPLYDDGANAAQEATRDYVLRVEKQSGNGALINIFGGKITTYRRLSESVVEIIEDVLGKRKPAWTKTVPLPGGDFPVGTINQLTSGLVETYPFLPQKLLGRLARLYGTNAYNLLGNRKSIKEMGTVFGVDLYACEVDYLMQTEFALYPQDILYRRTKLGLTMSLREVSNLSNYMESAKKNSSMSSKTMLKS